VSHANAALSPKARLRLARLVVDDGWPVARVAERFQVSWPTAKRWADRYRQLGPNGMADRSSRPHRQPNRTGQPLVRKIVHLRWKQRLGPVAIADQTGLSASTVHAVLVRCKLNRLSHLDRVTGEPVRRYEHATPGALLHVDVTKFGNVPDGGGHRFVGRQQGGKNRAATAARTGKRSTNRGAKIGTAYGHTVLDDHSRVAYAEIHDDETAATAIAVLRRAVSWFKHPEGGGVSPAGRPARRDGRRRKRERRRRGSAVPQRQHPSTGGSRCKRRRRDPGRSLEVER